MSTSTAVLIVTVEIDPADDEEFNRWYDQEHVPEKLHEPGYISARRFRAYGEDSKYMILYELETPEAATTPPHLRKDPTEWGKSVMARWKTWNRGVWVDLNA